MNFRRYRIHALQCAMTLLLCAQGMRTNVYAQEDRREVSLDELLAYAEVNAPSIKLAREQLRFADAAREEAAPAVRHNPTLTFGVGPRLQEGVSADLFVSVEQPFEISGARSLRLEAAQHTKEQLQARLNGTRLQLLRDVTLAYRNAELASQEVRLAEAALSSTAEILATIRRRLAAGDASAVDLRLAEAEQAEAEVAKIDAEGRAEQSAIHLSELTGWPLTSPPKVTEELAMPANRLVAPLADLLRAATSHPVWQETEAHKAESAVNATLAAREAWPTPAMGVELHRESSTTDRACYVVLGTLGIDLPLWQRNQGARLEAEVTADVAALEQDNASHSLRALIATSRAALVAASARLAIFESQISPGLEEHLSLIQRGFEVGELPLMEISFARSRLIASQRERLHAIRDYYAALAELEYAIGARLTTPRTSSPPMDTP